MITKELVAYIRGELSRGIPRETLTRVLRTNGWDSKDIEEAFGFIKPAKAEPLPVREPKTDSKKLEEDPTAKIKIQSVTPKQEPPKSFTVEDIQSNPLLIKNSVKDYAWQPAPVGNTPAKVIKDGPTHKVYSKQYTRLSKILRFAGMAAVGLLVLSGGVYGYMKFTDHPERLLIGTDQSVAIESFQFKMQADIHVGTDNALPGAAVLAGTDRYKLSIEGAVDAHEENNPATMVSASVSAPVLFEEPVLFEARFTDGIFYLRVPETDLLDLFISKEAQPDAGSWISFSQSDTNVLSAAKPALGEVVASSRTLPGKVLRASWLSDAKKLAIDRKLIKKFSSEGKDTIDGVAAYKVGFKVDTPALAALITDLKNTTENDNAEVLSFFETLLTNMQITNGTIWIGIDDHLVHRVALTLASTSSNSLEESTVAQVALTITDFNKMIDIAPPSPALSASQILATSEKTQGQETARQLLAAAAFTATVYSRSHTSYSGICGNKQGFFDLINDIAKADSPFARPTCRGTSKDWILFAPYGRSDVYWCVDSTGANTEVHTKPAKTSCGV